MMKMPQPLSGCGLFAGNVGTDADDDALKGKSR
jgi:hypothetical protein